MARTNSGSTSNYLLAGSNPVSTSAFTLACWGYTTDAANGQNLISIDDDSGATQARCRLAFQGNVAADPLRIEVTDNSGTTPNTWRNDTGAYSTSVWQHCAGVVTASDATAYLNGTAGSDTTSGASALDTGHNCVRIGATKIGGSILQALNGRIAWPAIWSVALAQGEIDALAAGAHPLTIRPDKIIFFAPLTGATAGNEIDIIGGLTLTETGTIGTAESPLVSLGGAWPVNYTAAAGGGATIAALAHHHRMMLSA